MNLNVTPVSFKARIIIEPKAQTAVGVKAFEKQSKLNPKHRKSFFVKLLTKIIKPRLTVKIKDPS
ncbi:MAG: hypothetical protein WCY19_07915 [Candidatus Gastranaerophilaceae bacterium]